MAKRCCGTHPYLWWYDFVYFRILSAYILDIFFSRKLKTCLVIFPALCLVLEDDHTCKESFFPLHHFQSEANLCTIWPNLFRILKSIYSEKATKFCEIFTLLLSYVVPVKSKMKILQNYVAFSEYMNFNDFFVSRNF